MAAPPEPAGAAEPAAPPVVEPIAPEVPRGGRVGSDSGPPAREVALAPPPRVDIRLGEADLEALAADQQDLASVRENLRETAGLPPEPDSLIAAAIRVGLGEGKHVPLATIAAEAGVGVGTLYRRYPNREALLEAMQERAGRLLLVEAEDALEQGATGLDAVERFLVRKTEHQQ